MMFELLLYKKDLHSFSESSKSPIESAPIAQLVEQLICNQ